MSNNNKEQLSKEALVRILGYEHLKNVMVTNMEWEMVEKADNSSLGKKIINLVSKKPRYTYKTIVSGIMKDDTGTINYNNYFHPKNKLAKSNFDCAFKQYGIEAVATVARPISDSAPQKNWGCQWLPNSNVHGDGQLCGVANIVVREKSTGKLELLCPHSWLFINDIRYMKHDVDMCYAVSNQRATTNSLLYHMASKEKFFWDTIKAGRTK